MNNLHMQTASMIYEVKDAPYLFNLVDTPGHADFAYEVSRSLASVQGVLLVIDATTGIQAQTMSHYFRAKDAGIKHIIPVVNKIDLPTSNVDQVINQLESQLGISVFDDNNLVHLISAKTGKGVDAILPDIVNRIPSPGGSKQKPFKALLIDSWYESYRGVICLVSIFDGTLKSGDQVKSFSNGKIYNVEEVGLMRPIQEKTDILLSGQVGYVIFGIKSPSEARIGDTFYCKDAQIEAIPGFKPCKPVVYAGFFPAEKDDFEKLQSAIERLLLNDSSVHVSKTSSSYLGIGWRLGFLGTLHLDVFRQRLEQEFQATMIITTPSVQYKAVMKDGTRIFINSIDEYPNQQELVNVRYFEEPMAKVTLVFPTDYIGPVMHLCSDNRITQHNIEYLGATQVKLIAKIPLAELIGKFNDKLLSISAGYASLDYVDDGWEPVNLVKIGMKLNGESVDVLGALQPESKAASFGRVWTKKLASLLPRQQFAIAVQAAVGTKVIARETISAVRKDVTAKCYGGDKTRQSKLLEKQKEGKRRMKMFGKVEVPHEAFLEIMRLENSES